MAAWRDRALIAALVAVGVAALLGPLLGKGAAPASDGPGAGATSTLPVTARSPSVVARGLGLAAADVVTTATPDGGTVLSVRLTAHLRSADVLMLRADPTGPAIRFTLVAPQSVAVVGTLHGTPSATIPAGAMVAYDLTFDLRGLSVLPIGGGDVAAGGPPNPGTWLLTVDVVDVAGMRHHAETPVVVTPTA